MNLKTLSLILALSLTTFLIGYGAIVLNAKTKNLSLRIGYPGEWKTLHPGLQHTVYGDLVLSNKFDSLVGYSENGVPVPLGASSWIVSEDQKVFTFQIDRTKFFSDGSPLTAIDFKRSWEDAAKLNPISSNNSLLDILYKLEGFEKLKTEGQISGIRVKDQFTLELQFSSPFRMALEHLQGNRFSAYKMKNGFSVGTGYFEIEEIAGDHITMHPRKDLKNGGPTLDVRALPANQIVKHLLDGKLDVIAQIGGYVPEAKELINDKIGIIPGADSTHLTIGLNTTKSSLFNKRENRIGLNYLIQKVIQANPELLPLSPFFHADSQFLLPLQAGRIEANEADEILAEGEKYAADLIEVTRRNPLMVMDGRTMSIVPLLRKTGLNFLSPQPYSIDVVYADNGPDIITRAFSVTSGDPDGLYHALGRNGAIRTKYVFNSEVSDLLEDGRKIVQFSDLNAHYKFVNQKILSESTFIHLGVARALLAYRKDTVELDTRVLTRNSGQLHLLRAK